MGKRMYLNTTFAWPKPTQIYSVKNDQTLFETIMNHNSG